MLEQTVNEMQSDLIKMRQASAQVSISAMNFLCLLSS
jgi:phage shock protein A